MKNDIDTFDFGDWIVKLGFSLSEVKEVINYLKDESAIAFHLRNRVFYTGDNEILRKTKYSELESNTQIAFSESTKSILAKATNSYLNHTIVYIFSCFEDLLFQSTHLCLSSNVNIIKRVEQINSNFKFSSMIELRYFQEMKYSIEIINLICYKASKYIVTGEISKSLQRFEALFRVKFEKKVIDYLQSLQNKRNAIVHETGHTKADINIFNNHWNIIESIFETLKETFENNSIKYIEPHKTK